MVQVSTSPGTARADGRLDIRVFVTESVPPIELLNQGVEAWNAWHAEHRGELPDRILTEATLEGAYYLAGANLGHTDVR